MGSPTLPRASIDGIVVNKNPYSGISATGQGAHRSRRRGWVIVALSRKHQSRVRRLRIERASRSDVGETRYQDECRAGLRRSPSEQEAHIASTSCTQDRSIGIVNAQTLGGPFTAFRARAPERNLRRRGSTSSPADRQTLLFRYDYNQKQNNVDVSGLHLPELGLNSDSIEQEFRFQSNTIFSTPLGTTCGSRLTPARRSGAAADGSAAVVGGLFRGVNQSHPQQARPRAETASVGTHLRGAHTLRLAAVIPRTW